MHDSIISWLTWSFERPAKMSKAWSWKVFNSQLMNVHYTLSLIQREEGSTNLTKRSWSNPAWGTILHQRALPNLLQKWSLWWKSKLLMTNEKWPFRDWANSFLSFFLELMTTTRNNLRRTFPSQILNISTTATFFSTTGQLLHTVQDWPVS